MWGEKGASHEIQKEIQSQKAPGGSMLKYHGKVEMRCQREEQLQHKAVVKETGKKDHSSATASSQV